MISEKNLLAWKNKKVLILNIALGVFFTSILIYLFIGYSFGLLGLIFSIISGVIIGTIIVVFMLVASVILKEFL